MSSANSSSLIHFTRKISTLKLILRNGIRYSYAFESLPDGVLYNLVNETTLFPPYVLKYNEKHGVAIPMVSFCDIPLTRALEHSRIYGKYGIGIEKEFMLHYYTNFFNPIIYSASDSLDEAFRFFSSERLKTMERILEYIKNGMNEEEKTAYLNNITSKNAAEAIACLPKYLQDEYNQRVEEGYNMSILLALYKPYKGINYLGKEQVFYDEREWRAFFPHADKTAYSWDFACTREDFLSYRDELNVQISNWEDGFIKIPQNCFDAISHIIVKNDYQRDYVIDFILKAKRLFGYPIDRDNPIKYKLISKISSFDKNSNDY